MKMQLVVPMFVTVWSASILAATPDLAGAPEPERPYLTGDWNGMRTDESGMSLELGYTQEYLSVVSGGIQRKGEYDALVSVALELALEKLVAWRGAIFHIHGIAPIGSSISSQSIGDDSNVSNINYRNSARIFETWIEQNLADGKFSIRAGQMAADTEFFGSEIGDVDGGGLFINSDFGAMPIASFNAPVPIYAISALGVRVRVAPAESTYLQVALFDGNPAPDTLGDPSPGFGAGDNYNDYGIEYRLSGSDEGYLLLGEVGFTINQQKANEGELALTSSKDGKSVMPQSARRPSGLPGSYKIGGYYHSDDFTRWSDGAPVAGSWAAYAIAAQKVFHENESDAQGLYFFARGSIAPEDRATLDWAVDGGINYVGLIPGREGDNCGAGYSCKHYSRNLSDSLVAQGEESLEAESILEISYQAKITPWLAIQPDFQYVSRPGGRSSASDATVLGVRVITLF